MNRRTKNQRNRCAYHGSRKKNVNAISNEIDKMLLFTHEGNRNHNDHRQYRSNERHHTKIEHITHTFSHNWQFTEVTI